MMKIMAFIGISLWLWEYCFGLFENVSGLKLMGQIYANRC